MWIFAVGRAINMTQVVSIEFQRPSDAITAAVLHLPNGGFLAVNDVNEIAEIVRYYQVNSFPALAAVGFE